MTGRSAGASVEGVTKAAPDIAWRVATLTTPVRFYPRFGPLPGVVEVVDQSAGWTTVGERRMLRLSDGGSVVEHLTRVDRPNVFAYELSDFRGLFGRLVAGARAEWVFTAVPGGTSIRWSYAFTARRGARPLVAAIVALLWGPYMRRVLPVILDEGDRAASALDRD